MTTSTLSRLGEAPEEGIKAPVKSISSGNIALFDIGQDLAGYIVQDNDRIAVNGQTDTTENGIYVARQGRDWVRASDFNANEDVVNGQLVVDANTSAVFIISAPDPWQPGTDSVSFGLLLSPSGFFWGAIGGTLSNQGDLQAALDAKAALVHTHVEADITDLQPYLLDAPTSGEEFARQSGAWVNLDLAARFANISHTHVEADITDLQAYLLDAPGSIANDGELYARQDGAWAAFSTAAGTVGEIIIWPDTDPPENFLLCDGSSYNTTVFSDLFAVLGYKYGGSGPNFNVPDLRGEFVRGTANGSGKDPGRNTRTDRGDGTTGDFVGTKQAQSQLAHSHSIRGGGSDDDGGPRPPGGTSNNGALEGTQSAGGVGEANEIRPRNVGMNFMIRFTGGGSGITQPPSIEIQDNGTTLTTAVELLNFLNFNLTEPLDDQINIAFGASPNAAAFCPNYGFTFVSTASFSIPGVDATNTVFPGRRLRFVDGALNYFGTVTGSGFFIGSTQVNMDMDGSDVLTNSVSEFCIVNGAGGWTPIAGDPFSGGPVNDIIAGFIGSTKYWVAIGNGGNVAYSTDGALTWQLSTSVTAENLNQIDYNPDSETFIAVGNAGVILRSTDGENWTADTTSIPGIVTDGNADIFGIIYDEANTDQWLTLHRRDVGGQLQCARSTDDGQNWVFGANVTGSTATLQTGLIRRRGAGQVQIGFMWGVGEDAYQLVDSNDTTSSVIYNTSSQPFTRGGASFYFDGATNDAILKGNQLNRGATEVDDVQYGSKILNDAAWIPSLNRLVVVGEDSVIGTYEAADFDQPITDYSNLQANGGNPLADYLCVHWDPDDGIIAAGNNQGQIVRSVNGLGAPITPTEYTGFTLIAGDPFAGAPIRRVMSGLIGATTWWVAIGNAGALFTSTDAGATWQSRASGLTGDLLCIDYNPTNQQFVVGSRNGEFTSSTNGSTWTADTTTIPALGLAGSNDIHGVLWDAVQALWWWCFNVSAGATTRSYTTPTALTPFTIADSTQSMRPDSIARITTTGNVIIFADALSEDTDFYNGASDNSETVYGQTDAGTLCKCVGTGPGTVSPDGPFTHNVLHGYDTGEVKRFGSTTGTGSPRALKDPAREPLAGGAINGIAQDGTRWVLVGDGGEIYTLLNSLFDSPFNVFEIVNNPFTADINDVWYDSNDGVFVAVGSNGQIATSPDGIS